MQVNLKSINYYVEGRGFEWAMGVASIPAGFIFLFWPAEVKSIYTVLASHHVLGLSLIALGWSRCAALMLNGQEMFGIQLGPYVRAVCGVLSAILWMQFTFALVQVSMTRGYPSPGIPFWAMFTLVELYAAYTTVKNG